MLHATAPRVLVTDANVLIDYAKSDPEVLSVARRCSILIEVPNVVLDEVDQLDAAACVRLGIEIVEIETEVLVELAAMQGPLSLADRACLWLATAMVTAA
jgi:hypothetical protein